MSRKSIVSEPRLDPVKKNQNEPISRLPGRNSKIASMARNLVPWGPTTPNLGSPAGSLWAVGEGWFENTAAHLIFGGNLY